MSTRLPSGQLAQGDQIQPDEVLTPGDSIFSNAGRFRFGLEYDLSLTLHRLYPREWLLWASPGDQVRPIGVCIMQGIDGNLVVYAPGPKPVWATGTDDSPGSHLIVQDDGNVVIYRPDGKARWATDTALPIGFSALGSYQMDPGTVLYPGEHIISRDFRFTLTYQTDGNLVLLSRGSVLWASGTERSRVGICTMQMDGNLVIYAPGPKPVWASGTDDSPGSRLIVQDDGNVVIRRKDGTPRWATGTTV